MSELTKLKIWACETNKFEKKSDGQPFTVQINPESFAIAYPSDYATVQGKGQSGATPKFVKIPPRKLSFEILFDNTGATPTAEQSIVKQINALDKTIHQVDGKKHKPNFLLIEWGALVFKCCLESMTITYKLFAPNGQPLRASVNVSFQEVKREKDQTPEERLSSPDLTHARTVREGDSLPAMAEKIYGDGAYYIAVAQANKLIQFRNLRAGKPLVFPPINKQNG